MRLSEARHAFITGGASGIGLGIAEAFAARGIKVTIADIDAPALDDLLGAMGDNWHGTVLDVRDRPSWARAKVEAEATFGPVDILVNNAGIAPNGREFADMEPESFDRIIAINLTGVANGVFTFAREMRDRRRGHIVNTASMAGLATSIPGIGAYSVAKFGVVAMSEGLRGELAPYGVGVSVLCPSYVATNLSVNTAKVGGETRAGGSVAMPPSTLSPAQVGAKVAAAIDEGRFYIITHPEAWTRVAERHEELRAAFAPE
ncbi:MAG: SDR family NAD(P)-dependent oxidoreductase [Novosphingobium sp.]|nr:SDR family NAD(P)-dependent oxidoreductase [Novosphingobium sp.]